MKKEQKSSEEKLEAIKKRILLRLKFCEIQNGLNYCKNCGLSPEDLELSR